MRLLVIDDDEEILRAFQTGMSSSAGVQLSTARSLQEAEDVLESAQWDFDVVICDLLLPVSTGDLDKSVDHGKSLFTRLVERSVGTLTIIFSGQATIEMAQDFIQTARQEDIFGTGSPTQMVQLIQKHQLDDCIERVRDFAAETIALAEIELQPGLSAIDLESPEEAVLRVFARRREGAVVRMKELGGGLSGSRTIVVRVVNSAGTRKALAVAKIGHLSHLQDEKKRYEDHVAHPLAQSTYTALVDEVKAGAGQTGGLFYKLAEGYDQSLFDLLRSDPDRAADAVRKLMLALAPWREGAPGVPSTIGDIRRSLVSENDMETLAKYLPNIDLATVEIRSINVRRCSEHGDLHGLNVLVDKDLNPVIIDFGAAREATASLDPITLELSAIFHPQGFADVWPSVAEIRQWPDLTSYEATCPYPGYLRACREWTLDVAMGNREVWATVYAYALRQLKYHEEGSREHALALALVETMVNALST